MGFIEDLTTYYWNWFVYGTALFATYGCWVIGGWGLLWDDDDGQMI